MRVRLVAWTPYAEQVVAQAMRACTEKATYENMGEWIEIEEANRLIKHAIKSGHMSVLEHASFTFYVEGISRVCSHQLVRHRHATFSQKSSRNLDSKGENHIMPESLLSKYETRAMYDLGVAESLRIYRMLTEEQGIPPEDARYLRIEAMPTSLLMTMNASSLYHFLELRLCQRAQWEIRQLAEDILGIVQDLAPGVFQLAGPTCITKGYCREVNGCGKAPTVDSLVEEYYRLKGLEK